jgi:hypothetical protein
MLKMAENEDSAGFLLMPEGPDMPLVMQSLHRKCLYFFVRSNPPETSFFTVFSIYHGTGTK